MTKHIDANPEAGKRFYQDFHNKGKIVMLNLLRFRPIADYTGLDIIKPEKEISGEEAYQLYMESTLPELKKAGSRIIYYGKDKLNSRPIHIASMNYKCLSASLVRKREREKWKYACVL